MSVDYFKSLKILLVANENYIVSKNTFFPLDEDYVLKYLNDHNIIRSQLKISPLKMEDLPTKVDWEVWCTILQFE